MNNKAREALLEKKRAKEAAANTIETSTMDYQHVIKKPITNMINQVTINNESKPAVVTKAIKNNQVLSEAEDLKKRHEQIVAAYKGQLVDNPLDDDDDDDVEDNDEVNKKDLTNDISLKLTNLKPRQLVTNYPKSTIAREAIKRKPIIKPGQNPKDPTPFIGPQLPAHLVDLSKKRKSPISNQDKLAGTGASESELTA